MTDIPEQHHPEVVRRAEELVDLIRGEAQRLLDGLADRPKPNAKAEAREALVRIMKANAELWRFMEGKKPLEFAPRGLSVPDEA